MAPCGARFLGLLIAIMVAGMGQQALATRIQRPPDLVCDASQVELVAGVITGVETQPELLKVYLQSDWGTNEIVQLSLPEVAVADLLSQRSPLQTADLPNWLIQHGPDRLIRVWTCTATALQLWEVPDTKN